MSTYHIIALIIAIVLMIKITLLWIENEGLRNKIKWMHNKHSPLISLSNGKTVIVVFAITKFHEEKFSSLEQLFDFVRTTLDATNWGSSDFDQKSCNTLLGQRGIYDILVTPK